MSVLLMSSDKPGCSALVCGSTTPPAKCSSCVGSEDCGKTLESRGLRQPSANLVPQFLFSGSGFGRKRHYRRPSKGLAEGVHRLPQLVPDSRSHLVATITCGRPLDARNSSNWPSLSWGGMFESTSARHSARLERWWRYGSTNRAQAAEISRETFA